MDVIDLFIIFVVGIITASFGTLVGGMSLITIPTLIFLGLPPLIAIGTNRFGVLGLLIAGWYKFDRKGMIDYKIAFIVAIPGILGSVVGANLVLQIDEDILTKVIAIITFVIFIIIVVKPKLGVQKTKLTIKSHEYLIGIILSFFLGIYVGFYGGAAGTFLSYILILLFGQTFLESAGTRKIANFSSAGIATAIFALSGGINYTVGLVLFVGSFVGSYIGAHYSDKIGNIWIKRLFYVVVSAMIIKLIT